MKMNGRQGETVGLTGASAFTERHLIGRDLPVGGLLLEERDLSSPYADTPTRRYADTSPLP
jgi:hypothetical protein